MPRAPPRAPVSRALALAPVLLFCCPADAGQRAPKASWKDGSSNGAARQTSDRPLVGAAWVRTRDVAESLRDVLSLGLGYGARKATEVRLPRLKEALRPMYNALPKNAGGNLGRSTVRYAMHRHFLHHHGMYLKGLEPAGEVWNSSSPSEILEDKVPDFVVKRFEDHLAAGLDLDDLALLAAALEHFMHMDAIERLKAIYRLTNHSIEERISEGDLTGLLERFLVLQITGFSEDISAADLEGRWRGMASSFPTWPKTQAWLRTIQESALDDEISVGYNSLMFQSGVNFQAVTTVLQTVMERFGRHQDADCKIMAASLLAKEDAAQKGRVKLADFYQAASGMFVEKKEYLMELGAIEERRDLAGEVMETYVLIPNYLQSTANCLPSSSMCTVCCLNPCEELLRHIEIKVGKAAATPEEILKIVASLPSATIQAPRTLPDVLIQRLKEIAMVHELGGRVRIHGRLFSQWLHHAYPHECPMPAKAGTTRPMTAADWLRETNTSSAHTLEEISTLFHHAEGAHRPQGAPLLSDFKRRAAAAAPARGGAAQFGRADLPWDLDEELVFEQEEKSMFHELRVVARALAMIGASCGLLLSLTQLASSAISATRAGACVGARKPSPPSAAEAKMV